jgi:hypothetical protein
MKKRKDAGTICAYFKPDPVINHLRQLSKRQAADNKRRAEVEARFPSDHVSGKRYYWSSDMMFGEVALPDELLDENIPCGDGPVRRQALRLIRETYERAEKIGNIKTVCMGGDVEHYVTNKRDLLKLLNAGLWLCDSDREKTRRIHRRLLESDVAHI